MDPFYMLALTAVAVGVILLLSGVVSVKQGFNYTIESFGKYTKTLGPGLSFIIPFYQRIGHRMNMMEQVLDVPQQEVITKDNAMVSCDAVVFIQVIDAVAAAYEVNNLQHAIQNLALTNIRTVVGSMDLDEVLSNRDDINARLLAVIDAATNPWGVKVTRIEIADLSPPADITEAMARQMKAERMKRAEILEAEGQKQSQILRAEGEKQSAILEAEGRREAAFRDAEAREREGEAEAKATAYVSEAIAKGDVNAVNYFLGQKYVDAFAQLATGNNQKTVIIPAEFSSIIGTIEGIKGVTESAKEVNDNRSAPNGNGGAVPPTRF